MAKKIKQETISVSLKKSKISSGAMISKKNITERLFVGGELASEIDFMDLPNPNKVLQKSGVSAAELFENMLDDDHVYAVTQILTAGILRHQWKLNSKNKKHKDMLEKAFNHKGNIRNMIKGIVMGRLKGMAIFEIGWDLTPDGYIPAEINPLPCTDFSIGRDGKVTHIKSGTKFGDEYAHKIIAYRNNPFENPYGVSELLKCYYPWQFKKGGWRFWMTTTEKYGVPTMVVEVDMEDIDEDDVDAKLQEVSEAFFNIDSDTVVVTNGLKPNGVHTIEAKAKADEFEKLINKAESAISKVIIGTHILMDSSAGGSRALSEVSANINFRFKVQEAILDICSVVNEVIFWFNYFQTGTEINKYDTEFLIPYIAIQEWDKIVQAITLKVPVSKKGIYQHIPEPEDENDIFVVVDPISPDKDLKKITPETKTDNEPKKKSGEVKDEPREETSVPGKQNTGENQ